MSARTVAALAGWAAVAMSAVPASAEVAERWSTHCVTSRGLHSCVDLWGPPGSIAKVIAVPGPRDEREAAAAAERERLWLARCKPVGRTDAYGVRRFWYAAPGCEFGRYED